jgi:hypothetical protein
MATTPAKAKRIESATKAWSECYARLGPLYELYSVSGRDFDVALAAAESETAAYVNGSHEAKPREALSRWEDLMNRAIATERGDRSCSVCGLEHVVVIINRDGSRVCGRCRRGFIGG